MRFLIDTNLPRSTAALLSRLGHEALDVCDIGLGAAEDDAIARHARAQRLALITRDFDFADIRNYPPADYASILVLELPDDATATIILKVIESFLGQRALVERLPGRLAIVQTSRVRFRPA